ncbi:hypothetical protein HPP92_005191 [Vanilla planifolia]|uniref:Hexosyltransferase n=1 Tax=Vanilla planifolia TaxID=51239 RepID=A0A835VCY9_VANPL|nr:hypothetical protein HPP92_005191 [Vanilla planifolia]
MQVHISPAERRVTVSGVVGGGSTCAWEVMKVKGSSGRWLSYRSLLPTMLLFAVLMPFLFIRTAFLALDAGASICPSIGCLGRTIRPLFFRGEDNFQELAKELRKIYEDEVAGPMEPKMVEDAPDSWNDLMAEMASYSYQNVNPRAFILRTKAMLMKMDQKLQLAKLQASIYQHLASIGVPKNMHCLSLRLAEEYLLNANARSFYHHLIVSSTVACSRASERLVFHIITDKKTYTAMHAWFALNSVGSAIVEVKGLHQFDWPPDVNAIIMETIHAIQDCLAAYRGHEALSPSTFSLLNYFRIHLPELFPKLGKVIVLDDDVVVLHDLSPLWDIDLNGRVVGAVGVEEDAAGHCTGGKLGDHINFSNPLLRSASLGAEANQCAWFSGMNVFNLEAWRRTNVTHSYQSLIKLNRDSRFALWRMSFLPPALLAFHALTQPLEASWHLPGLGLQIPKPELLETSAVLHFSGPQKPWLHVGFSELRQLWRRHLNNSDELLRSCRVVD